MQNGAHAGVYACIVLKNYALVHSWLVELLCNFVFAIPVKFSVTVQAPLFCPNVSSLFCNAFSDGARM